MHPARLLSWIWPVRVARAEGRHGMLELAWENGRLVVNSPRANQSHGALHRVWQRAFREAGLSGRRVGSVLLLGLGTGSVVHILRHELGIAAPITAVEHDPVMLDWGRRYFGLDGERDLVVVEGDARHVLPELNGLYDLVVVDLFEDLAMPPGMADEAFLQALVDRVAPGGLLLWNTIAQDPESASRAAAIEVFLKGWAARPSAFRTEAINRVLMAEAPDGPSGSS